MSKFKLEENNVIFNIPIEHNYLNHQRIVSTTSSRCRFLFGRRCRDSYCSARH